MTLPSACLVEPTVETSIPDVMDKIAEFTSVLSASHWFCVAYKHLSGVDLEELVKGAAAGDWKAVGTFASALDHLGEYVRAYGNDITQTAHSVIGVTWNGQAAAKADEYFTLYGRKVAGLQTELDSLSQAYANAASGMREAGEGIVGVIETLIDLVAGLPEIVILTVLSMIGMPVGIGEIAAIVDMAAIIYEAWNVVKLIIQLIEAVGGMLTAVQVVVGLAAGYLSLLQVLNRDLDLPGHGYDHPGV